jgi:hypothetical protein
MLSGVDERIEKVPRYVCLAPHNRLRADISNRPAARNGSAASPSRAIAICDGYSSPAPWPTFGTPPVADLGNHGSSHDWTNGRDLLEPSASSHDRCQAFTPQKRTSFSRMAMSALCQKQTSAALYVGKAAY